MRVGKLLAMAAAVRIPPVGHEDSGAFLIHFCSSLVTVAGHRHQGIFSYRANHINAASSTCWASLSKLGDFVERARGLLLRGFAPAWAAEAAVAARSVLVAGATDTAHLFFALDCNS